LSLPLTGVRVLDFTSAWAGPFATRALSFLGAEVIKVEGPARMDIWRGDLRGGYATRYPDLEPGKRPYNRNVFFNTQNHDKLSLVLDLKHADGRAIALRLAAVSDVVIDNFSPGVLVSLGLGYAELLKVRPDVIMVEMPAYGNDGPVAQNIAIGPNMEAMAGMSLLMGYGDGVPVLSGIAYLDPVGGLFGAAAVMTALTYRQRTGRGQYVEVPQREAALHWVGEQLLDFVENGRKPSPMGNHRGGAAPHDAYPSEGGPDEFVAIAVFTDAQWQALCETIDRPDLASDVRFATVPSRWANQSLLDVPISAWTSLHDKHTAARLLQDHGVPAAPVNNGKDIANDPHLRARGFFTTLEHPDAGTHAYSGLAYRLRDTPGAMRAAAPAFGQHNRQVLIGLLGMPEDEVDELERGGVIGSEPRAEGS
jgi:crotonobetainyl-CoA:carnitine CoA-transferase CaiB-like acyl-CoA transferase